MNDARKDVPSEPGDPTVSLLEAALHSDDLEGLGRAVLTTLTQMAEAGHGFLVASDPRRPHPEVVGHQLPAEAVPLLAGVAAKWEMSSDRGPDRWFVEPIGGTRFSVHPLTLDGRRVGWIGLAGHEDPGCVDQIGKRALDGIAIAVDRLAERAASERRLLHLNTYLTVSTMLSKSVDLSELLEIALFCSMEAVAAEAASILLLDESKEQFRFFRVEGPAKPLLGGATFPVTEGVAGRVLQSQAAEIVNDAAHDARFYAQIDRKTGFRTRSLIAVPLVAGEEPVGVLEVLNKVGDGRFTDDERQLLELIADEIAFAIRNASLFDYIVNTYCKRRQGLNSCKGCERPLGSWTPCMRYREFLP